MSSFATVKRSVSPSVDNVSTNEDDWGIRSHIPINMEAKPYPIPNYVTAEINRMKKEKELKESQSNN